MYVRPLVRAHRPGPNRTERRQRAEQRVRQPVQGRPEVELDRVRRFYVLLEARDETGGAPAEALGALVDGVSREVALLEAWVATRAWSERTDGETIRRTLDLLRNFSRLGLLDLGSLGLEARPTLVAWLSLEHRWCYAAAGTDRAAFQVAVGRTGAR